MGQDINLDFSQLKPQPDPVTSYANAFQVGQGLAKSAAMQRASGAGNAFTPSPASGGGINGWARSLNAWQRAVANQQAEIVGALGQGLAGLPYAARSGALAHVAPALVARGVPPAALAGFDPTDDNLAQIISSAERLRGLVAG